MATPLRFVIPPTGEPLDRARLVCWRVQPGESFAIDDVLLEVETDKSVIEIPSPYAGRLLSHLVAVDGRIDADTAVAELEVEGDVPTEALGAASADTVGKTAAQRTTSGDAAEMPPSAAPTAAPTSRLPITPAARLALRDHGLSAAQVQGTGPGGRITRADVARAVAQGAGALGSAGAAAGQVSPAARAALAHQVWEAQAGREGRAAGQARTVVLLHGLFADVAAWMATAQALSRSGLRVVALDLPGHGASPAAAEQTFDAAVQAGVQTWDSLGQEGCVLVGHSFGAAVAARMAALRPARASALVLISPLGLGTEIAQSFVEGVLHARTPQAMGRELARLTLDGARPSTAYLEGLCRRMQVGAAGWQQLIDSVAVHGVQQVDIRPDLEALACPVSLIHGRGDTIIPWQHALQAPPAVSLHLVPGAGHMPQWEASALVQSVIVRAARLGAA